MIIQVQSTQEFWQILEQNQTVLMEFYASWCPHCKAFYPNLEQASTTLNQQGITVAQTEIDTFADLANEFGIDTIPTLILFKNGKAVARTVGERPAQAVLDWVAEN